MRECFCARTDSTSGLRNERLVLLSGDIGNRLFNEFKTLFPDRFFNCGVAEANMMSMAAGMAMCGLRPVRVHDCAVRYHAVPRADSCRRVLSSIPSGDRRGRRGIVVCRFGSHAHNSCEDIALLRVLPDIKVMCPGDSCEVRMGLRRALEQDAPVYLRIGKKGEPVVHAQDPRRLKSARASRFGPGNQITLLSTGNLLPIADHVADRLEASNMSVRLVSLHTVKPLDERLLDESFSDSTLVVTLEEHSILGGLGGAVAEWLADHGPCRAELLRIGTPDRFFHAVGTQEYARESVGLDAGNDNEKDS